MRSLAILTIIGLSIEAGAQPAAPMGCTPGTTCLTSNRTEAFGGGYILDKVRVDGKTIESFNSEHLEESFHRLNSELYHCLNGAVRGKVSFSYTKGRSSKIRVRTKSKKFNRCAKKVIKKFKATVLPGRHQIRLKIHNDNDEPHGLSNFFVQDGGKVYGVIGPGRLRSQGMVGMGSIGQKPTKASKLRIGKIKTSGATSSTTMLRRYIRRKLSKIKGCYEKQQPKLNKQEMVVTFKINELGMVQHISSKGPSLHQLIPATIASCTEAQIKKIVFPKPPTGKIVSVTLPLYFAPPGPQREIGGGRGGGGTGSVVGLGGSGVTTSSSPSKDVIRKHIRSKLPNFKYCYEKQLILNPALKGKVTSKFTIGPNGNVIQAQTTGLAKVAPCIEGVLRRIQFPKPTGGGKMVVTYPFVFNPPK